MKKRPLLKMRLIMFASIMLVTAFLLLFPAGNSPAATYTDTWANATYMNPISTSSYTWQSYTFNILQYGYDPATEQVDDVVIGLYARDDYDASNSSNDSSFRFYYGTNNYSAYATVYIYHYLDDPDDDYQDLIETGLMDASIRSTRGDFQFTQAVLTVTTSPLVVAPPELTSTDPVDLQANAVFNAVSATFDSDMDPLSINTSTFKLYVEDHPDFPAHTEVPGTVSYDVLTRTAAFAPSSDSDYYDQDLTYTALLTTGVATTDGNNLEDTSWGFSGHMDTTAPAVGYHWPEADATDVNESWDIEIAFDEYLPDNIDINTIHHVNFTLVDLAFPQFPVPGILNLLYLDQNIIMFDPDSDLQPGAEYEFTVSADVMDNAGNSLSGGDYQWRFTVRPDPCNPDITPPSVIPPDDVTFECDTSHGALEFTNDYGTPILSDICDDFPTYGTAGVGAEFHMGDNEVIWVARDQYQNESTAIQIVTVVDTIAPSFTPPASIIAECVNGRATVDNGLDTIWATDVCNGEPIFVDGWYGELTLLVGQSTSILWEAADFSGNLTSYAQTIAVEDTIAPSFTPPSHIITECVYGGTPVDLGSDAIWATDECDGDIYVDGPYGTVTFADIGLHDVLWEATDSQGNITSHVQTVNITDYVPPQWYEGGAPVIDNQILSFECTSPTGTEIDWSRFSVTDNCDADVETSMSDPGPYPLGSQGNIEWFANNNFGNLAQMRHWVVVSDTTPPGLTPPPDITVACEHGGTTVDLGRPVFSDICSDVSITGPNSPVTLTAGEHTFEWSAGDDSGNVTLAAQTVTVVDDIPPTPRNAWFIEENCTAQNTPASDINLDRFRAPVYISDNCDDDILMTNDAPATFPIGDTTVTWTMTDDAGNTFQGSHAVRINDSFTYQLPPDVTVVVDSVSSCPDPEVDFGIPTLTNPCDTPLFYYNDRTYMRPSTDSFPIGTTPIVWSSIDPEGVLTYRGTQNVTVEDPEGICICPNDPDRDIDGDEICGDVDNCPAIANPDQADNDLDGSGDACDPDDDNDGLTDEQEAAAGTDPFDPDSDDDTVGDAGDVCPLEDATGFDADMNGCIDTLAGMTNTLDTLVAEGVIDSTLQNSLVTKVAGAEKAADKENICAAINKLGALKNEVNAQAGKKISHEAAALVTNYTNNLITQLLNQLPEGATC